MIGWNEDEFLEAMMPLLQNSSGSSGCPDQETLCAAVDGSASNGVKMAIAAHTTTCPICAGLAERLRVFDELAPAENEREWSQVEERLDHWLEISFPSGQQGPPAGGQVRESRPHWWQNLTAPLVALRIRTLLIPASALALLIFAFLAGRISVRFGPQEIAQIAPPRDGVVSSITPSIPKNDNPSETKPTNGSRPRQVDPSAEILRGGANRRADPGEGRAKHLEESAANEAVPQNVVTVAAAPTSVPSGENAPAAESPLAPDTASLIAQNGGPPPTPTSVPLGPVPGRPVDLGAVGAVPSSVARSVVTSPPAASPSDRKKGQRSSAPGPSEITLLSGTRVWISLKSVTAQTDGTSNFSGVLLLPVTQSGATLLDQNTQISGIVSRKQGKTMVEILELVSSGGHYRLQRTGEANTSGAGTAVRFEAGKVLETWITSTSIFGKLPGESKPLGK